MHEKEEWQLNRKDFERYPIWYFPMDDSVEDETFVRPLTTENFDDIFDVKLICIKTEFIDKEGGLYSGYITWDPSDKIGHLQPVLFIRDEVVCFWSGMIKPDRNAFSKAELELLEKLPIQCKSIEYKGAYSRTVELEGLYYRCNETDTVVFLK